MSTTSRIKAWYSTCYECDWESDWCASYADALEAAESHAQETGHTARAGDYEELIE